MKIAVASDGLDVSNHFQGCTNFNYYEAKNGSLISSRNIPSQPSSVISKISFLQQIGVTILICGIISTTEATRIQNAGITVVSGASGRAIQAATNYLEHTQ